MPAGTLHEYSFTLRALALANAGVLGVGTVHYPSTLTYPPPLHHYGGYNEQQIADFIPLSDGCSGKVSWLYNRLFGRDISCVYCCYLHDWLYLLGGPRAQRKAADELLRDCAASAGYFPPGWRGKGRRLWRRLRAWVMYVAVRLFGGSHWG